MTLKRLMLVCLIAGCMAAPSAMARGNLSKTLTVLVIPSRYTTVQVGMDMIQRHYVVLVAYQGEAATSNPALHVWDGKAWRPLSLDQFRQSTYLKSAPGRIIMVGDDATLPTVLAEAAGEASRIVMGVASQDTTAVINSLGKVLSFRRSEWDWFAKRYGLELSDENAELRKMSWYDKPYNRSGGEAVVDSAQQPKAMTGEMPKEDDIQPAVVVSGDASTSEPSPADWQESAVATDADPEK
jgi:hypothetical protein